MITAKPSVQGLAKKAKTPSKDGSKADLAWYLCLDGGGEKVLLQPFCVRRGANGGAHEGVDAWGLPMLRGVPETTLM